VALLVIREVDKAGAVMQTANSDFDVAIVGAGPAGLSAAICLGRCRRKVVVFDHAQPRNEAATAVHGYLGHDGIPPHRLRALGRKEALRYGAVFVDAEVTGIDCVRSPDGQVTVIEVEARGREAMRARKLLLATGMIDELPPIPNIREYYGISVHHCPYCDGWEHRDQRLVAFGDGCSTPGLALSLKTWSSLVTACTNGSDLSQDNLERLQANGIAIQTAPVLGLRGSGGVLSELVFADQPPLVCDALFFHSHQTQRSRLAAMVGCHFDEKSHVSTYKKQFTGVNGVYVAGDANGEVQFAIVAAAEGAIAATAINRDLQEEKRTGDSVMIQSTE
jgi:thioredoxin reductase